MNWFSKIAAAYSMNVEEAYDFMGLQRGNVSESEFKKRYRELAFQYHPDRAKDEDKQQASEQFKQLQEAARVVLKDIASVGQQTPQQPQGEWHEETQPPTGWAEEFMRHYPDFQEFLNEVTNNPAYDYLDEADAYDQENAYVAWGMKKRNERMWSEHADLLTDERNRLPDPNIMGKELAIRKYQILAFALRDVERLRNEDYGQKIHDDILLYFAGQRQLDSHTAKLLGIIFQHSIAQNSNFTTIDVYPLRSTIGNLESNSEYYGGNWKAPPNYIEMVQQSGNQYLQEMLRESVKTSEDGRPIFVNSKPVLQAEEILKAKVNRFVDKNINFYAQAIGETNIDDELKQDWVKELYHGMECDDEPDAGVFPYCIDYHELINQGYVLDAYLNQRKRWLIDSIRTRQQEQGMPITKVFATNWLQKIAQKGDCFRQAAKWAIHNEATVVHAMVTHPADLRQFWHAWGEKNGMVTDLTVGFGDEHPITTEKYYSIFKPKNVIKYTWQEALRKMFQHKQWGPWDA